MLAVALSLVVAAPPRVCLVEVNDPRAQAAAGLAATLETALGASFEVTSQRSLVAAGRALRLPRGAWAVAPGLGRLLERSGCEVPLRARLSFSTGAWSLSLVTLERSGAESVSVSISLGKPRLSSARARELVEALAARLAAPPPVQTSAVEPAPSTPETPAPAPAATNDGWTVDFDTPAAAPSVPETLKLETTVEVGGRLAFEHYGFFVNDDASKLGGRDNIEGAIRLKAAHPRATLFASVLARVDLVDPARNRFDPEEAWAELTFPNVSVRVGRLLVSHGTATLYNATDVLNHVDLRDPLDSEKVGAVMARATGTFGPLTLEAAILPVPESHWFPEVTGVAPDGTLQSRSRWVRGSVDVAGSVPVTYRLAPLKAQTARPSNTQAFGRAEVSVLGADIGLGYGYLIDHIPSALVEAVPVGGLPTSAEVFIDWSYRRLHVITFDFEKTFGKLRLIAEGAAFLTADLRATNPRVADPYVLGVVGADFATGEFLGGQKLHFFLEFSIARALVGKISLEGLDGFRYPFPLSLLGRVSWSITDDLEVELNGVTSVERLDVLVSPRVAYQFFDRVKLKAGADVMAGDRLRGFFGPYASNSRFLVTVEATF